MKFVLLIALSLLSLSAFGQASTLKKNCSQTGFSCGECDTKLQDDFNSLIADITGSTQSGDGYWGGDFNGKKSIKPGVTLEKTLARIKDMMKSNNPEGGNGLNMIVIGQSESLQPSAIRDGKIYPRVALKSPNSELWVTFSTDPTNAAYQTLEVMRWNGKDAKYEFMELNFNRNERQVDGTGTKCLPCHKEPDPRPNWDTYRAWSGVVPSRDDMIEMHSKNGKNVRGEGEKIGTDGRAYLSFLEQIVEAKERRPKDRLAMLDLPVDNVIQFKDVEPPVSSLSPRKQLEAIQSKARTDGFYRIPHYPYKDLTSSNFDTKTADYTGPSQAAFDQMSGQNCCRISERLKQHPEYQKFKYYLAGAARGCFQNFPTGIEAWIPESMQNKILSFYRRDTRNRLRDLAQVSRLPTRLDDLDDVASAVMNDTRQNLVRSDEFKFVRHEGMLTNYLQSVENVSVSEARTEAQYFSREMLAPVYDGDPQFHAIGDEGGVKGVPNGNPEEISALRTVLEPLGVNVNHWSMMRGDDPNYNSLAFSDQFVLLFEQAAIKDVIAEIEADKSLSGTMCSKLQKKSYQSLADAQAAAQDENQFDVESWCIDRLAMSDIDPLNDSMKDLMEVNRSALEGDAKEFFRVCLDCHGSDGMIPFPGMDQLAFNGQWTDESWRKFNEALRGDQANTSIVPLGPDILTKLSLKKMPPGGWEIGATKEEKMAEDVRRRSFLSDYVKVTMVTSSDEVSVRQFCQSVTGANSPKNSSPQNTNSAQPAGANEQ